MTDVALEIKRLKVQLKHVDAAKDEQDLRIHERLQEIERLKEAMKIQDAKILEINDKIKELSK